MSMKRNAKPVSADKFVAGMMALSPIHSMLILTAIKEVAQRVAATQPASYPKDSIINPQAWVNAAQDIEHRLVYWNK